MFLSNRLLALRTLASADMRDDRGAGIIEWLAIGGFALVAIGTIFTLVTDLGSDLIEAIFDEMMP